MRVWLGGPVRTVGAARGVPARRGSAPELDLADRLGNRALQRLIDRSRGRPLTPSEREKAARSFAVPPEGARVHDDAESALAAATMGVRAFTRGADVYLGGDLGLDPPGRREETVGHELAHVVQAHDAPSHDAASHDTPSHDAPSTEGSAAHPEAEATAAGRAYASGEHAAVRARIRPDAASAEPNDPSAWERIAVILRSLAGGSLSTGAVAGPLRAGYNARYAGIQSAARGMTAEGASSEQAARFLVGARNALKESVRGEGPGLMALFARLRNRLSWYRNPVGPSYDQLAARAAAKGVPADEIPEYVLGRGTSPEVNRLPGRANVFGTGLAALAALVDAYASYREGRPAGQIGLRSAGTFGGALALPGMYGPPGSVLGMPRGSWSGGLADFVVNIANAGLQWAGAPRPVTALTQTGAELTPSSTMFAGVRSALDFLYAGVASGPEGLERVHQEQLRGSGGGVIQGYAMLGALAGGGDLDFLTSPQAARGDYGIFVESGNYWGDVFSGDRSLSKDLADIWDFLTD